MIFSFSYDNMSVADVPTAPDAFVKGVRLTDVTGGHPSLTCLQVKE